MPEGAVYVGRPTKWGNPYKITRMGEHFKVTRGAVPTYWDNYDEALSNSVARFREYMQSLVKENIAKINELRGKDLACWCPLDQPCHADVLLELANPEERM